MLIDFCLLCSYVPSHKVRFFSAPGVSVGRAYRYPFESPVIRVLEGDGVIPRSVLSDDLLTLPGSDGWTPSRTIITTLEVFFFFFRFV